MLTLDISTILFIVATILGFIFYVLKYKDEALKKIWSTLMQFSLEAEKLYGDKTGQVKKSYVINLIINSLFYKSLPSYVKLILTDKILSDLIDKFIKETFNTLKDQEFIQKLIIR